ncbi:hypothetical protein BG006_001414 [Podila minutissima]|uniref:Uncharacterized protein n=1 Tax=Podila minutissima TaxID=64525 RepID=A0A9P5STI7_9FUNG|nr:hypothetical protein BG006_001414 [Podila minutissima]
MCATMTLITPPTESISQLIYTPAHSSPEDTHYYAPVPEALSWLLPATLPSASSPAHSKYRTLASIQAQAQLLHYSQQQNLRPLGTHAITAPIATTTSTKPTPADIQDHQRAPSSITSAIQEMDGSHGTCFLTWIHNPANLDYISLRLRPLCLEYPLVEVANVLRWIGADWSSSDCKALFRAVTQSWDGGKRRMLAFLLIRDEEMRQKAKSKLVEFAQKSKAKLRRPSQYLYQHQQHVPQGAAGPQQEQEQLKSSLFSASADSNSIASNNNNDLSVLSTTPEKTIAPTASTTTTTSAALDLAAIQEMVATSLITGEEVVAPVAVAQSSVWQAQSPKEHNYSIRYTPYSSTIRARGAARF